MARTITGVALVVAGVLTAIMVSFWAGMALTVLGLLLFGGFAPLKRV